MFKKPRSKSEALRQSSGMNSDDETDLKISIPNVDSLLDFEPVTVHRSVNRRATYSLEASGAIEMAASTKSLDGKLRRSSLTQDTDRKFLENYGKHLEPDNNSIAGGNNSVAMSLASTKGKIIFNRFLQIHSIIGT